MMTKLILQYLVLLLLFFVSSNLITPSIFGVPFTLQTIVIMLVPFIFNLKNSVLWFFLLILLTALGIPMMSKFSSGVHILTGNMAGFIWGWLLMIILIKLFTNYKSNFLTLFIVMALATLLDIIIGAIGNVGLTHIKLSVIFTFITNFIFFGLIKVIITIAIIKMLPARLFHTSLPCISLNKL